MISVSNKDATVEFQGRAMAELIVSVCICAIGLFFFIYSGRIEAWGGEVISPSLIPRTVSALIVILGLIMTIRRAAEVIALKAQIRHVKIPRTTFSVVLPFVLLSFIYALLFYLLGYFISTCLITAVALLMFKNRNGWKLAALSLATGILFYVVFIIIIGVYDPPGIWMSINPVSFLR
jgi:hypothetical protein